MIDSNEKTKSGPIAIRDALANDISFIYKTWLDSYRYGSNFGRSHRNSIFYPNYKLVIDRLLEISRVNVACDKDDSNVILGYVVFQEPCTLHYIYVKGAFRGFGIAKTLFRSAFNSTADTITYTHQTAEIGPILDRYQNLIHDETLLLTKGEYTDVQTPESKSDPDTPTS